MVSLQHLLRSSRLVVSITSRRVSIPAPATPVQGLRCSSTSSCLYSIEYSAARKMSQKSITSFFMITPKKTDNKEDKRVEVASTPSPSKDAEDEKSPVTVSNGKEKKKSSKRQRVDSSESDASPEQPKKSSPVSSDKKKKTKRLRIESSESEPELAQVESEKLDVKVESKPRKYESPRNKKSKTKLEMSPLAENVEVKEEKIEKTPSPKKQTKKRQSSAKSKVSKAKVEKSPLAEKNGEKSPEIKKVKVEADEVKKKDKTMSFFIQKDIDKKNENSNGEAAKVKVEDYNPAKPKYHPINDACWTKGEPVPYLALAKTLEAIEATSARLKIVEILSNYLRSVIALTPEDLLPSVYMCLNQLAPAYHSLELGIAETYLMKAIGQCTGRTLAQVKAAAQREGDLGRVAQQARAAQRVMCRPRPLTARAVFHACREIAHMTGQASVNKKMNKIQQLYTACRLSEAKYLIRSLEGKLRIGLAEQSVLQALALAAALTPPAPAGAGAAPDTLDASKGLTAEQLKARVDEHALIIKTTYCECPNYDMLIPALLQHGVRALPQHCRLTPGIPLKPMLAHPTKHISEVFNRYNYDMLIPALLQHGVRALPQHCRLTPGIPLKPMLAHPTKHISEVFNRFEGEQFTCEWKYDGERAQIHVPSAARAGAESADFSGAAVFSRNQENNTSKYPDIIRRLPAFLKDSVTSCVLDAEAVAYDTEHRQILPFQILSTRKRKDAVESDIKVQVCVFAFDLLYLNGRALVGEPLAERRRLLREHFHEVPGSWQFATSRDCSTTEEVQQFLEESVRGSCEGLMVKMLAGANARYDIARRSHNWLKLKKDYLDGAGDSIDAVVIGGWWGRGKRAGLLGGFLLACRDADQDEFQALCKIGTGFSDEDLKTLTETLKEHVIDAPKSYYRYDSSHAPDVWLAAAHVWEVRCADLSLSPAHRAAIGLVDQEKGISLRFPRFVRAREDKTPEQATDARQVAAMYLAQDQVRNQAPVRPAHDDFY